MLQEHEKSPLHRATRCLYPHEIQERFGLPTLKEHYEIPTDNDSAQSSHNQRLRGEFRAAGLFPQHGDISVADIDAVHSFDESVRQADQDLKITLQFTMPGAGKKKRASDDI